jgi:hypothetical protein
MNLTTKFLRESNMSCHEWLSVGITMEGNTNFPLRKDHLLEDEQGLSMRGLLAVKYDTPKALFTLWFRLWFVTNLPLGILMS